MSLKTLKMRWIGIRPLVMHNGMLADNTNPIVKEIKQITGKPSKNRPDDEWKRMERLEWEGGLYWSDELGPYLPSDNIERCLQLGAQKSKRGKDIAAAVFCTEAEIKLDYTGPRDKDKLHADPAFTLRRGVIVSQARVMRVRPMFPSNIAEPEKSWQVTFEVEYASDVIGKEALIKAANDAGTLVGLGDWRPKFGRFIVEILE